MQEEGVADGAVEDAVDYVGEGFALCDSPEWRMWLAGIHWAEVIVFGVEGGGMVVKEWGPDRDKIAGEEDEGVC